jgi:hypothetical protein
VRHDRIDGSERGTDCLHRVDRFGVQAPLAVRETVRGHVDRDDRSPAISQRIDERRPERMIVLPSVDQQDRGIGSEAPCRHHPAVAPDAMLLDRDETLRHPRLRPPRRLHNREQEGVDGCIEVGP